MVYVCKYKMGGLLIVMQEGWIALHYAADRGHVEVLHLLLIIEHCDVIATNKVKAKIVQWYYSYGPHLLNWASVNNRADKIIYSAKLE